MKCSMKCLSFWKHVKKKGVIPHSLPAHPRGVLNRKESEGEVCLVLGGKPGTGNGPGFHGGRPSTEQAVV